MTRPLRWTAWMAAVSQRAVPWMRPSPPLLPTERAGLLFDDAYYAQAYFDVADPGFDRFTHFMEHGWREGRNPAAWFDTLFYRDVQLHGACENPLLHYVETGQAKGLATRPEDDNGDDAYLQIQRALCSSYFSEDDYRRQSGYDGADALGHYLRGGWRLALAPSLLFNPGQQIACHLFMATHDVSPLYHHASQRRLLGEGAPPSGELFVEPPPETLISRSESPTVGLKPPRMVELEPIPESLRHTLFPIWQSARTRELPIETYRLRDVYVTGEGLVFTEAGRIVDITRYSHTDGAIKDGVLAVATARQCGTCRTVDAAILARNRGALNYGHFILESLPRAWFARTRLDCRLPVLIQGGTPIEPVAREALRSLGFGSDEVIACGPDPVRVRDLVVVHGLTKHPLHVSPIVLDCFDEIASRVDASSFRRVYAARGGFTSRDFVDEAAVATTLRAYGFHRACTGEMHFEAQVALFKGASHVVGIGGAALTNLLFCRPGTRVTVISPSSAAEVLFWMIAELRGLDYEEVRCREVGLQQGYLPWNRAIDLTPAELKTIFA